MSKTVLFQTIQFSISTQFRCQNSSISSISTQFSSIWPIDRTLSSATTPSQSGPASNGNEAVLRIPQSSSITGTSPCDCLVSYPGNLLGESYSRCILQPQPTEQLEVKVDAIIIGTSDTLWDVLLLTEESKDHIFKEEYLEQRRTTVAIYSGLHASIWWNSASHDSMHEKLGFDLMVDNQTFYSICDWKGAGCLAGN